MFRLVHQKNKERRTFFLITYRFCFLKFFFLLNSHSFAHPWQCWPLLRAEVLYYATESSWGNLTSNCIKNNKKQNPKKPTTNKHLSKSKTITLGDNKNNNQKARLQGFLESFILQLMTMQWVSTWWCLVTDHMSQSARRGATHTLSWLCWVTSKKFSVLL